MWDTAVVIRIRLIVSQFVKIQQIIMLLWDPFIYNELVFLLCLVLENCRKKNSCINQNNSYRAIHENVPKYYWDQGLVQAPRPNAGRAEKTRENLFFFSKKIKITLKK